MSITSKLEILNPDNVPNYLSFEPVERALIEGLYFTKLRRGEFEPEDTELEKCLEKCAILYRAQKCAFQDVLTEKGFDPVQEALKDYEGRIAFLSCKGTLAILGKPKKNGRLITVSRIHSPDYDCSGSRQYIREDLKLHEGAFLTEHKYSPLIGLAINPRGSDDDELEAKESQHISMCIGKRTALYLINDTGHKIKSDVVEAPLVKPDR